ncbi:MAG: dephospho-CoA kinase [Calditrichia bacterium]|nr:dephospho-CoA kinase [Calditrichia bacterium]
MKKRRPLVIAVTGGMGTGQSSVCQFLHYLGAKAINADKIAKREIENNAAVQKELKKTFGAKIFYPNGKLNRKLLARLAFADEAKTVRLNKIVHPQMVSRIIEIIESARDSGRYSMIAVDAALIFELSLENMFDAIVVVTSKMQNRLERIKLRDKLTDKEISDRMSKQIPIEDKMQWADHLIENNGTLKQLEENTKKLFHQLKGHARKKS